MKTSKTILVGAISIAIFATNSAGDRPEGSPGKLKVLSLCELHTNAEQHHRQKVVVKGIFVVGLEAEVLYDPACPESRKHRTVVEFSPSMKQLPRKLRKLAKRDRRALVVFEGTFFGPEPPEVDPGLPAPIREKLQAGNRRYGHMEMFDTMIEVTAIKKVEKVPADVAW